MSLNGNDGAKVREAIKQFGKNIKSDIANSAPFNKNVNGRIVGITTGGYTVEIQTKRYYNLSAINAGGLQINDIVACCIPNNQMSQAFILGKVVPNTEDFITANDVHDGVLTFSEAGVQLATFSANQSGNASIDINVSNPNLWVNSDFLINQRGKGSYNVADKMCVDMIKWRFDGTRTLTPLSGGGIRVATSSVGSNNYVNIEQKFLNIRTGMYTFQVWVSDSSKIHTIYCWNNDTQSYLTVTTQSTTTNKIVSNINITTTGRLAIGIQVQDNAGGSVDIYRVKLEYGWIPTSWITPNPDEELAKCKRYCYIVTNTQNTTWSTFGTVYGAGSSSGYVSMPIHNDFASAPTVSGSRINSRGDFLIVSDENYSYAGTSFSLQVWNKGSGAIISIGYGGSLGNGRCGYITHDNSVYGAYILLECPVW